MTKFSGTILDGAQRRARADRLERSATSGASALDGPEGARPRTGRVTAEAQDGPSNTTAETLYWHEIDSPIGRLLLAGDGASLIQICFQSGPRPQQPRAGWVAERAPFRAAIAQLEEYFAGSRHSFDLPLAPRGTDFQRRVWRALREIPYGKTISYGELARRIGNPSASRAVGLANGANPLPIVVPCHRVIGADGSLTGFGGGLPIKRKLLALEGAGAAEAGPQESFAWIRERA